MKKAIVPQRMSRDEYGDIMREKQREEYEERRRREAEAELLDEPRKPSPALVWPSGGIIMPEASLLAAPTDGQIH